jgi:hypothetical protein
MLCNGDAVGAETLPYCGAQVWYVLVDTCYAFPAESGFRFRVYCGYTRPASTSFNLLYGQKRIPVTFVSRGAGQLVAPPSTCCIPINLSRPRQLVASPSTCCAPVNCRGRRTLLNPCITPFRNFFSLHRHAEASPPLPLPKYRCPFPSLRPTRRERTNDKVVNRCEFTPLRQLHH